MCLNSVQPQKQGTETEILCPPRKLYFRLAGGNLHRTKHAKGCWRGHGVPRGRSSARRGQARRVHACPRRAPRKRARQLRGSTPAVHLPRSRQGPGQSCRVLRRNGPQDRAAVCCGETAPTPQPVQGFPAGQRAEPRPGGPCAPSGTSFVAGRRRHFLLLAHRSGSWPERYRSASRVKRPQRSDRCLGGLLPDGAACQHPTGDGLPRP